MRKVFINFNNFLNRLKETRLSPGDILILTPHCLRDRDCTNDIVADINNCQRCGNCQVKDLGELSDQSGIKVAITSGGLMAKLVAKSLKPKAIIAVACEKELVEGIVAVLPVPVFAIINQRPYGPCRQTSFDFKLLKREIDKLLRKK